MATPAISHPRYGSAERQHADKRQLGWLQSGGILAVLTAAAVVIHGFHPYAEDGGLYLAGVKRMLDPTLYPGNAAFVDGHLRFSLFAPAIAGLVRATGIDLSTVVLLIHLATIAAALSAAWMLAGRCFRSTSERVGAVALLTVWLTLPIAGTSLMLMDPYVTARSISTPLTVFALVMAVDFMRWMRSGHWRWGYLAASGGLLAAAAAMHPLMAAYGCGCILVLGVTAVRSWQGRAAGIAGLSAAAVVAATVLRLIATPESSDYKLVAMSRYYWFLSQWHWYELVGAAAPLIILGAVARQQREDSENNLWPLAWMGVVAGSIALLIALVFARVDASDHLVARMQPMRVFQMIYIVMIVLLGGRLARRLGRNPLRWVATFALLSAIMIAAERKTFPSSDRIEMVDDDDPSFNAWVQAFDWIRTNTPKDALFALDADYITRPGEDAQGFRAIAERSALPDYSKDGGEAAITPWLTTEWERGQRAQAKLSERSDAEREAALAPRGVGWVVLESKAVTNFTCGYANATVKVCRLPDAGQAGGGGLRVSLRQPALPAVPQQPVQR